MMKVKYIIGLLGFAIFMSSCGSARVVSDGKTSKDKVYASKKVEKVVIDPRQDLYDQSFKFHSDFSENSGTSLNSYTLAYIGNYNRIAVNKMLDYHIPASITLAQGILESGNGRSELTRKANNHFGIKCHKNWSGKKVYHDDDKRGECFRKYTTADGSFNDHSEFLTSRQRYASLFEINPKNYKAWAKGLKKAGYATDRKYPHKLIKIIEDYQLHEYDQMVIKSKHYKLKNNQILTQPYVATTENENLVVVNKGDTLWSIAKNNKTTVSALKELNNLNSNEISVGQYLYLPNK